MNIRIYSKDFELTSSDKDYIKEKISSLVKYYNRINNVDIEVGLTTQRHQKGKIYRAELNIEVPGRLLRVEKVTEGLYKAIDKVRDHMARELRNYKEKNRDKDREGRQKN